MKTGLTLLTFVRLGGDGLAGRQRPAVLADLDADLALLDGRRLDGAALPEERVVEVARRRLGFVDNALVLG
jgi:hypothetical protein